MEPPSAAVDTICDHLLCDHKRCDERFERTEGFVTQKNWNAADASFEDFMEAFQRHVRMEEQVLLPAFQQSMKGADGAVALLRSEHRQILAMLSRMSDTVNRRNWLEFLLHCETFSMLREQHGMKEEAMLYPLLDKLPRPVREDIMQTMREHLHMCEDSPVI